MKNKFILTFYGIIIALLSFFVSITTYYIYEIDFQKIVGSFIVFCYEESYYASPIRNLYLLGIIIGLVLVITLILFYCILNKIGAIDYLIIYFKNMKNKVWKFIFMIVLSIFGYIFYISLHTINAFFQIDISEGNIYFIFIISLLVYIIILLLITPILLYLKKKAFSSQ